MNKVIKIFQYKLIVVEQYLQISIKIQNDN
jgi:hypothetical protein